MKRNIIGRPKPVETQIYYVERIISIYQVMDSQLIIKSSGDVFTLVIIFPIFTLPSLFSRYAGRVAKKLRVCEYITREEGSPYVRSLRKVSTFNQQISSKSAGTTRNEANYE